MTGKSRSLRILSGPSSVLPPQAPRPTADPRSLLNTAAIFGAQPAEPAASRLVTTIRGPARKHLRVLYDELDAAMAERTSVVPLSCRPGCSECCHLAPDITSAEAAQILDRVEQERGRDGLRAIYARCQADMKRANPGTPEWHLAGLGCAFLEDNLCTVYSHRPLSCRVHAVASPPELCDHNQPGLAIELFRAEDLRRKFLSGIRSTFGPAAVEPLPVMMVRVLEARGITG